MKNLVTILTTGLCALGAAAARERTAGQSNDTTDKVLIANERALYGAVAGGHKAPIMSLVAAEGVWTTRHGFVPMNLLGDGLGGFNLSKWDIVNPRVTRVGEDAAVVLYAWTGTGTFGDQPLASTTLAVTVWVTVWTRRNDKWLAIHHQETALVPNERTVSLVSERGHRTIGNIRAVLRLATPVLRLSSAPPPHDRDRDHTAHLIPLLCACIRADHSLRRMQRLFPHPSV